MTEIEKRKRWPNVYAMCAGKPGIPDDISEEEAAQLDRTNENAGKPDFIKFATNVLGPVMRKISKERK